MKIYFDFDLGYNVAADSLQLDGDAKMIVDEISSFVEGRLKPLEDLMNKESDGYVLIIIGKPEIRYYYSESLSMKMIASVTEEDYRYITSKIYFLLNQQ